MMEMVDCVKKIVDVVLVNKCYVLVFFWYLFNFVFWLFVLELLEIFLCMFFLGKFLNKIVKVLFDILFGEEMIKKVF